MADARTVLDFAKQHDAKILDLRFTDIPGLWHHVSYPIGQLTEASFEEGFGIDGSSSRGWAGVHESDMLLRPDANFHLLDPFTAVPTLVLVGSEDTNFLAATDYMARKIPNATKVVIEGAGHAANLDEPESFNRAVREFLERL